MAPGHAHRVSDSVSTPFLSTLRWLAAHAGFPAQRLPEKAETLLLINVAAQQEEVGKNAQSSGKYHIQTRDGAKDAALRAHAMRRSLVHYKCDNSAKV